MVLHALGYTDITMEQLLAAPIWETTYFGYGTISIGGAASLDATFKSFGIGVEKDRKLLGR